MTFFLEPDLLLNFRFSVSLMAKLSASWKRRVRLNNVKAPMPIPLAFRFQKIKGFDILREDEASRHQGGQNLSNGQALPKKWTYRNLTLERGIFLESPMNLLEVHNNIFKSFRPHPKLVVVIIVHNGHGIPQKGWCFNDARLKRWSTADLDAEHPEILIESLELSFSEMLTLTG